MVVPVWAYQNALFIDQNGVMIYRYCLPLPGMTDAQGGNSLYEVTQMHEDFLVEDDPEDRYLRFI